MLVLAKHWLPDADPNDPEVLGQALWLEQRFVGLMTLSVQNGIARAFKG